VKLPPGDDVEKFIELRFKPGSWYRDGIPERGCRVRAERFERLVADGGSYTIDDLIHGLMDWLDVTDNPEPALKTLRMTLDRHFPPDGHASAWCRFLDEHRVERIFHVGAVNCTDDLVTWQRRGWLIALAQASTEEPGRIVVSAAGPITLSVALRVLALSVTTYVLEPFDSYVGAQTMSRGTGSYYAWQSGAVTTCHWGDGLGKGSEDRGVIEHAEEFLESCGSDGLAPNQLAMMIAIAAGYQT
jgi:hypothetical protein